MSQAILRQSQSTSSTTKTIIAGLSLVGLVLSATGPALAKTVSHTHHNPSFKALKAHAKGLKKSGRVKVRKHRRHGRVVGFTKFDGAGKKVTVKRARHGKAKVTITRRKSFLERVKHRVSNFKNRVTRSYRAAKAAF